MNKKEAVVIHHTVTPQTWSLDKTIKSINTSHKNRGFPKGGMDLYIGYHYVIHPSGEIKQTRRDNDVGAHCREKNMNFKSIGVALVGNFNKDKLEGNQYEALINLLKELSERYKWTRSDVYYHGQFKATACAGLAVKAKFEGIKDDVFEIGLDIPEWAEDSVEWAIEKELIVDWSEPNRPVNRYELAEILFKYNNL